MSVSVVLFDMDGVRVDSEPFHDKVNEDIYKTLGIVVDKADVNEFIGRTSNHRWTSLKERYHLNQTVDALNDWQWKALVEQLPDSGIGPSDGLDTLLAFLKQNNIRASVASSSRSTFVEAVMDHLDLHKDMEGYTCGDEVENCKPAPDIFLLAAHKMDVDPSLCLVIEDSAAGVSAAKAAGMYAVGYDNPTSEGQDLSQADVTVKNLADICGILSALNHL
jgi:beta-phosphoglucomutase